MFSERFNAQALQNDERFVGLDMRLQHLVICLTNSHTSLSDIVNLESEKTRALIVAQAERLEKLHVDDRRYDEIMQSLFYPDIFFRQEQVDSMF